MERRLVAMLTGLVLAAPVATAAGAGFDDPVRTPGDNEQQFSSSGNPHRVDTPDDPDYDRAELPDPTTSNLYDERYDLFGFPSRHTELTARYKDMQDTSRVGKAQVSGYNASGAWKVTRGRSDVAVAILDTGIRWNSTGLRTKVRLNQGELPAVALGDGVLDVDDFVGHAKLNGKAAPTGQDVIRAFSDGVDDDRNGFVDDIAGWDFFDDDNDPDDSSSYFAAENHGTGRAREAVERGNDGEGSIGVCPKCQFIPIRIWDTFVSDANGFALGIVYGVDNGASVIEGANGSLYHSAFAEAASRYAYEKGVVQTYSGDDLNTANHNYPANYGHAMLIQGNAIDTHGLGQDPSEPLEPLQEIGIDAARELAGLPVGTELPVSTYFRGANTTQFGGKSSISMEGATGSENTGKASGAAAMVISAARDAGITLRPDETRAILEQTAEDVLPANTAGAGIPDPAQAGWDSHFGWGRVNLGKAVGVAASGKIPPEAAIHSPDWYAPLSGDAVRITGLARSRLTPTFDWKLEYGLGQAPTDWQLVGEQKGVTGKVTDFGEISLAAVRAALATHVTPYDTGGPLMNPLHDPFDREFTVRLTVTAGGVATKGIDRRVLNALDDAALRSGFPKRLGTGGEAAIRYADLNGDGMQELVVPLEDGVLHAYRPDGSELPGWPVRTRLMAQAANHPDSPGLKAISATAPAREPLRAPVIVDLDGDGVVEIVATAGRHVYAWQPDGTPRAGFPVSVDLSLCRPQDQSQARENDTIPGSHRKCGFVAGPAAARLDGQDKPPSIVVPALDGHVYAIGADGAIRPGFPKELVDPAIPAINQMKAEAINQPAIGDLNGDLIDDIVVPSNETYGATRPDGIDDVGGLFAYGLSMLLANAAGGSNRVYAIDGKTGAFLPGWPIKINGAIQTTLPMIGPGHDPSIAIIEGEPRVIASATGSTDIGIYSKNGTLLRSMQQGVYSPGSDAVERDTMINLFESAVVGDVTGANSRSVVKYGLGIAQAANLLLVGQNVPYHHMIGAWDAADGKPMPAYPRVTEDYQFLSSSTIAKVDARSPANQVLAGTALGLLHAYDGVAGLDVPGFPKYTGGWLYSPAAVSADGRVAAITREGFLFEWAHGDVASCQARDHWPSFRHDQQVTGNLDKDGTPPGPMLETTLVHKSGNTWMLSFTAPGDDGACGTPAAYLGRVGDATVDLGAPVAAGTKVVRELTLPESGTLVVQARDAKHNLGAPVRRAFPPEDPEDPGPGDDGEPPTGGTTGDGGTTTPPPASPPGTQAPGSPPPVTLNPGRCLDATAPRSRFYSWARRVSRRGMILRGSSSDSGCGARVQQVFVAVNIANRGGRTCRALKPSGSFSGDRSCHRTTYLRASGTRSWRFRFSGRLPRGKYTLWVRGVDAAGNIERKFAPRNRMRFRIR